MLVTAAFALEPLKGVLLLLIISVFLLILYTHSLAVFGGVQQYPPDEPYTKHPNTYIAAAANVAKPMLPSKF